MGKLFSNKPEFTLGLDIGSRMVKIVQLRHSSKGIELLNYGIETVPPDAIVDGTVMDFDPVISVIKKILKKLNIVNPDINTTVEGKAVFVKKVKVPTMSKDDLKESISWEAEQHIPFDMDEVYIDFQILPKTNQDDKNMDILLVAVKKEKINNHLNLIHIAGLNPSIIDIDAFAVENAFEANTKTEPNEVVALINIGCSITNINVVIDQVPYFTRDITIGGNNFTKALQKELLLNFEEAEHLKINFGKKKLDSKPSLLDSTIDDDVNEIITNVLKELSLEISHSFDYYHSLPESKKITKVVLSGGAVKTKNLVDFLSKKLNIKVEVLNPFKNIIINEHKFNLNHIQSVAPMLTVAVGLGLRQGD